jgi:hypothetical protein
VKLAKPHIDVAVRTERLAEMLAFWQGPAALTFEELLPTGRGNHQHRHETQLRENDSRKSELFETTRETYILKPNPT